MSVGGRDCAWSEGAIAEQGVGMSDWFNDLWRGMVRAFIQGFLLVFSGTLLLAMAAWYFLLRL